MRIEYGYARRLEHEEQELTERYKDWAVALWIVLAGVLFLLPIVLWNLGFHDLAELSMELQGAARYVFIIVFVVCLIGAVRRCIHQLCKDAG